MRVGLVLEIGSWSGVGAGEPTTGGLASSPAARGWALNDRASRWMAVEIESRIDGIAIGVESRSNER